MSIWPWRKIELGQYVEFLKADEITEEEIFGYDVQKKAAQAIGIASLENDACFMMFFGIPGTGKSRFPYDLAYTLNHDFGTNYSLMYIKCDQLLRRITRGEFTPNDVIQELETKTERAWENLPSIIVFDEIDALSAHITGAETYAVTLTKWVRAFAKETPDKTLTIGITNWPDAVDFSVLRRVRVNIFFGTASAEVIGQIIEKFLGIADFAGVADRVCKGLEKNARLPLASDVVKGCQQLKKRRPEPRKMSEKTLCEDLIALIGGSTRSRIDKYLIEYKNQISKAMEQMKYWEREWATLCKPLFKDEKENDEA